MLDRLRPGIELVYWMHVGWEGYGRFYKTGRFSWGTPDEQTDALARLAKLDPAPWGIANGLPFAEKLGLAGRVVSFNYGRIEAEPSFPMTNYGGDAAYEGGRLATARGVMGNAQTHCVQLPNTFAFARGATGKPLNRDEYVRFADDLIVGQGALVVEAWEASAGTEAAVMRTVADRLAALRDDQLRPGSLKGLLFGSASRFVNDLVMQLRLRAALRDFCAAVEAGPPPREAVSAFLGAVEKWQHQHGYMNAWWWPELDTALRKLNAPAINSVLKTQFTLDFAPDPKSPLTPYEQLANCFRETETYTVRLMAAMKKTLETMP
jgi:hypothetical protein